MGGRHGGNEELAAVGVGAGVGHAQHPRHLVIHHKPLVLKLIPVNTVAPIPLKKYDEEKYCQKIFLLLPVPPLKVAALDHEVGDDPVDLGSLVAEARLPCAQLPEVLRCPRHEVIKQLDLDPPEVLVIRADLQVDL